MNSTVTLRHGKGSTAKSAGSSGGYCLCGCVIKIDSHTGTGGKITTANRNRAADITGQRAYRDFTFGFGFGFRFGHGEKDWYSYLMTRVIVS